MIDIALLKEDLQQELEILHHPNIPFVFSSPEYQFHVVSLRTQEEEHKGIIKKALQNLAKKQKHNIVVSFSKENYFLQPIAKDYFDYLNEAWRFIFRFTTEHQNLKPFRPTVIYKDGTFSLLLFIVEQKIIKENYIRIHNINSLSVLKRTLQNALQKLQHDEKQKTLWTQHLQQTFPTENISLEDKILKMNGEKMLEVTFDSLFQDYIGIHYHTSYQLNLNSHLFSSGEFIFPYVENQNPKLEFNLFLRILEKKLQHFDHHISFHGFRKDTYFYPESYSHFFRLDEISKEKDNWNLSFTLFYVHNIEERPNEVRFEFEGAMAHILEQTEREIRNALKPVRLKKIFQ